MGLQRNMLELCGEMELGQRDGGELLAELLQDDQSVDGLSLGGGQVQRIPLEVPGSHQCLLACVNLLLKLERSNDDAKIMCKRTQVASAWC